MKNPKGITLIELIVVITIIGILAALSTIAFNDYQVKYNVENEIKTLYSDLMGARMRAMTENRPYVVEFISATEYVTAIDDNRDGDYIAADDTEIEKYSKYAGRRLKYDLTWTFPGNTDHLVFDSRGLVNINGSVRVNRANSSEYDCIDISSTRIKMGKWDGSNCKPK